MFRASLLAALALTACSPGQPPAQPPAQTSAEQPGEPSGQTGKDLTAPAPADLKALEAAHDWQHEPGETLNAAWNSGVKALLSKLSRPAIIEAMSSAGFACIYGEGHEDYPDPAAVCTRSFSTRACQMDWEITSTADKGMVDEVDGGFRRDCVGLADDWPDKVKSAIDDQLAPAEPPH